MVDPIGMGVGVEVSRAYDVSLVRAKFAQILQNDVLLITDSKDRLSLRRVRVGVRLGKADSIASTWQVTSYFCEGEGQYSRECPRKIRRLCNSKGYLALNGFPPATAPVPTPAPAPATAATLS